MDVVQLLDWTRTEIQPHKIKKSVLRKKDRFKICGTTFIDPPKWRIRSAEMPTHPPPLTPAYVPEYLAANAPFLWPSAVHLSALHLHGARTCPPLSVGASYSFISASLVYGELNFVLLYARQVASVKHFFEKMQTRRSKNYSAGSVIERISELSEPYNGERSAVAALEDCSAQEAEELKLKRISCGKSRKGSRIIRAERNRWGEGGTGQRRPVA